MAGRGRQLSALEQGAVAGVVLDAVLGEQVLPLRRALVLGRRGLLLLLLHRGGPLPHPPVPRRGPVPPCGSALLWRCFGGGGGGGLSGKEAAAAATQESNTLPTERSAPYCSWIYEMVFALFPPLWKIIKF